MVNPRIVILASIGVLGLGIALYTLRAHEAAKQASEPKSVAPPSPRVAADGVGRRATDTPFDLRDRDRLQDGEAAPTEAPVTEPITEAPTPPDPERLAQTEPPAAVVGPPGSPTIEAAMAATEKAAQAAVEKVRSEMRTTCWDTVDRGGVGNGGVELSFSLGFDSEGHVITSAVQQGRESYIQGLDTCLAPFAHALEVPAPGEPVSVSVSVSLP